MLYDDKRMSQREGLYTVVGALVLAVLLFVLIAVHGKTRMAPAAECGAGVLILHSSPVLTCQAQRERQPAITDGGAER